MAAPNDTTLKKTCTKCGVEFPATTEYFHRSKRGKFGLVEQCRNCRRIKAASEYLVNREAILARNAAYAASHHDEIHTRQAAYYAEHHDEYHAYRLAHRVKNNSYAAAYRTKHQNETRIYQSAYYSTPHGKAVAKSKRHRRKIRRIMAGGSFTTIELEAVLKAHTDKHGRLICALCGKPIEGDYHIDHFIPIKLGGSSDAGNLRILHPRCNLSKNATHPHKLGVLI